MLWNKSGATHPIATIKCWMDLMGMRGGAVRPPLHPLTDEAKASFRRVLEATGWLERLLEPAAVSGGGR